MRFSAAVHPAHKLSTGATLLAAAVVFLVSSPTAAEATTIYNQHWGGGKCLDADRNQNWDGGGVQLWDCNGWDNQQWDIWPDGTIHSRWNGRCLDADPRTNWRGGTVYLWRCLSPPPPQQRWYRWANGEIRSALNGRCLDAVASGGGNPTRVQMWDCWGWANAKWTLDPEVSCSGDLTRPSCGPRPAPRVLSPTPPPPPAPDTCDQLPSAESDFTLRARVRSRARRSQRKGRKTITVGYGRPVSAKGRLTRNGAPVAGARICVITKTYVAGAARRQRGVLATGEDGRFSYRLSSGRSQRLWFVYPEGAAAASVLVRVRAPLSLRASRSSFRTGQTMTLRGRLRGRPRHRGVLVVLQARRPERWQTFGTTRTGRKGRFSFDYQFTRTLGVQVYKLRARMPAQHGSAFATGTSRVVRVRVHGS